MARSYVARNGQRKLEVPTTELFMPTVIAQTACGTHSAVRGVPCFEVPRKDENGYHAGICNRRALATGFDNPIKPESLEIRQKGQPGRWARA